MNDFHESPTTFAGVSLTPNVFTRLFDLCCDLAKFTVARTGLGRANARSTDPPADDPFAGESRADFVSF